MEQKFASRKSSGSEIDWDMNQDKKFQYRYGYRHQLTIQIIIQARLTVY
jgi:hypothetical protein